MKEKDDQPSETEVIKAKSVNPEFLAECEMESRKIHERNKELAYAELLKQRVRDEALLCDKIRAGFEKECV